MNQSCCSVRTSKFFLLVHPVFQNEFVSKQPPPALIFFIERAISMSSICFIISFLECSDFGRYNLFKKLCLKSFLMSFLRTLTCFLCINRAIVTPVCWWRAKSKTVHNKIKYHSIMLYRILMGQSFAFLENTVK